MSKDAAACQMEWTRLSERIIQARFYSRNIKLTIIHIYAPTEEAEEQVKEEFYTRLQELLDTKNQHDMLIITGDMNVKGGDQNWHFERVMGKHGLRVRNDNGEKLCQICDLNELVITGTFSAQNHPQGNMDFTRWKDEEPDRPCSGQQEG